MNVKSRKFLFISILIYATLNADARLRIQIRTQTQFDGLNETLKNALATDPTGVDFFFSSGTFYFSEDHISLFRVQYPHADISFNGNGTILTGKGQTYKSRQALSREFLPIDAVIGKGEVQTWSKVYKADGKVRIIDKENGICRISCSSLPSNVSVGNTPFIQLTEWYKSDIYRVIKTEGKDIFFKARDLDIVNYDSHYSGSAPRFRLCAGPVSSGKSISLKDGSIILPASEHQVTVCATNRFADIQECTFNSLTFNGMHFLGNSNHKRQLIYLAFNKASAINILNCTFEAIRSSTMRFLETDNVKVSGCIFKSCYAECVDSESSANTIVNGNTFSDCGKGLTNSFCIYCRGADYRISNNKIRDFGYSAIGVGVWYKFHQDMPSRGVIEGNEIWYSEEYFKNHDQHTLMDSGAIYAYTQNEKTVIRNNYIHDYTGMKDNRGIFLDDGACNITVTGNRIRNTPNSYSIDSRRVKSIESAEGSQVTVCNVGVIIDGNDVDGRIRLEKR